MSILSRAILIFALLLAATLARSDGIFNPGSRGIGFNDGISNVGAGAAPATPCSGTGLNFSVACNSQYIGII